GADAKVGRVSGVADQHDILVKPFFAQNAVKLEPDRGAAQMFGIGNEWIAVKPFSKKFFAQRDRLFLLHLVDTCREPVFLRRFNDECGPFIVKAVGMQVEPAPLCLLEVEGKSIELSPATKPDKAVAPDLNIGPEEALILAPGDGRSAI